MPTECRICYGEEGELVAPCSCTGSMSLAHEACVRRWARELVSKHCRMCGQYYTIDPPRYDSICGPTPDTSSSASAWILAISITLTLYVTTSVLMWHGTTSPDRAICRITGDAELTSGIAMQFTAILWSIPATWFAATYACGRIPAYLWVWFAFVLAICTFYVAIDPVLSGVWSTLNVIVVCIAIRHRIEWRPTRV
jgi:hypothetical protein